MRREARHAVKLVAHRLARMHSPSPQSGALPHVEGARPEGSAGAIARLGIGTAQFGLPYGVTNVRGQLPEDEVKSILTLARDMGIRVLDTANQYGKSESILGRLSEIAAPFRIVTKTPALGPEQIDFAQIASLRKAIDGSRVALKRKRLDALLVHNGAALLLDGAEQVIEILQEAKACGSIERIGVSVSDPDTLGRVLERFTPDIVQLPLNVLDQRFAMSGLLGALAADRIEIHVRSVFLQGLLLPRVRELPPTLAHAGSAVQAVHDFATAHGLTPIATCLGYALSHVSVGCVIIGVASVAELAEILWTVRRLPSHIPDFTSLAVNDPTIILPGRWNVSPVAWGNAR